MQHNFNPTFFLWLHFCVRYETEHISRETIMNAKKNLRDAYSAFVKHRSDNAVRPNRITMSLSAVVCTGQVNKLARLDTLLTVPCNKHIYLWSERGAPNNAKCFGVQTICGQAPLWFSSTTITVPAHNKQDELYLFICSTIRALIIFEIYITANYLNVKNITKLEITNKQL